MACSADEISITPLRLLRRRHSIATSINLRTIAARSARRAMKGERGGCEWKYSGDDLLLCAYDSITSTTAGNNNTGKKKKGKKTRRYTRYATRVSYP